MITTTSRIKQTATPATSARAGCKVQIPFEIAKKYRLQEGDMLALRDFGRGFIVFIPGEEKNNKDGGADDISQAIWDKMEEEADNDIKSGRISKPFDRVEDLLKDLKTL